MAVSDYFCRMYILIDKPTSVFTVVDYTCALMTVEG